MNFTGGLEPDFNFTGGATGGGGLGTIPPGMTLPPFFPEPSANASEIKAKFRKMHCEKFKECLAMDPLASIRDTKGKS